jgi:polysaccharide biosynthesis/export protein
MPQRRQAQTRLPRPLPTLWGLAVAGVLAATGANGAQPLVEPGDVLRITFLEEPELGREAKVGMDGRIMLPHIGGIDVQGSDLDTIRQRIEAILAERDIIRSPNVVVEVVSYRPLYVGGTVAHPGSITFEAGLTVRHALLLAGGVLADPDSERLTGAEMVKLRAQLRATRFLMLQTESRIARLEAELSESQLSVPPATGAAATPDADLEAIRSLDAAQLADIRTGYEGDAVHMQNMMALLDLELDVLERQSMLQQQESDLQNEEVRNARALFEKGLIPQPRLQELQRESSRLSRDMLENSAFAARARQNKATLQHELGDSSNTSRIEARRELAEAMGRHAELEAEYKAQSVSLFTAGLRLADPEEDLQPPEPVVTIYRNDNGREHRFRADMATPILPGDLLEVTLSDVPQG